MLIALTQYRLHNDHLYQLITMKWMSPAASPLVAVQRFALTSRGHSTYVIKYQPAGYDHARLSFWDVLLSTRRTLSAQEALLYDLIRRWTVCVWIEVPRGVVLK